MQYRAQNGGYEFLEETNLLESLLKQRGVEDPKHFLNVSEKDVLDGMLLENMDSGLSLLNKHIEEDNRIHVQCDSDVDGLSSAAFIIKYIKKVHPKAKITYTLHTGKEHGIILDIISCVKFDLLIVPDAGTNDIEQSKTLKQRGKDVLILDHHDIEKKNNFSCVINVKDGQYSNPTLSGVGVCYKFAKEYDKKYGFRHADSMDSLLSLGLISDSMDLRNYETRYLVLKGLEKMTKENIFLQALIKKNEYQIKDNVNIKAVGWYIAPYLNSCIRAGTKEEKINMFKALLEENEEVEYTPRKSKNNLDPEPVKLSLQEHMANELVKIKARQDREVKKGVEELNERIAEKKLDENKILIVDCSGILDKVYTGLVANKLATQYKRPVLLLRESYRDTYGGSARNYGLSFINDFRGFLQDLGTFNWLRGHAEAFGFNIDIDNLVPTRDKSNELFKDVEILDTYLVDYEIPVNKLKEKHIREVAEWGDIWGNGVDEPLFAITNIYMNTDNIQLTGSRSNIIKFESRKITFTKRFSSEEEYNRMILKQNKGLSKKVKSVRIDLVGKFVKNTWEDREFFQVEIVDFKSISSKDFIF